MADAVPPQSVVAFYDPSGKNKRSSAYNQLLHAMLPSNSGGLQAALGPMYATWITYRNNDTNDLSQEDLFKKFANKYLDPNQTGKALTAFEAAKSDPLNLAFSLHCTAASLTRRAPPDTRLRPRIATKGVASHGQPYDVRRATSILYRLFNNPRSRGTGRRYLAFSISSSTTKIRSHGFFERWNDPLATLKPDEEADTL